MEFYCAEKSCIDARKSPYTISLPTEVVVDEHNRAELFCPFCKSVLVRRPAQDKPAAGKTAG